MFTIEKLSSDISAMDKPIRLRVENYWPIGNMTSVSVWEVIQWKFAVMEVRVADKKNMEWDNRYFG